MTCLRTGEWPIFAPRHAVESAAGTCASLDWRRRVCITMGVLTRRSQRSSSTTTGLVVRTTKPRRLLRRVHPIYQQAMCSRYPTSQLKAAARRTRRLLPRTRCKQKSQCCPRRLSRMVVTQKNTHQSPRSLPRRPNQLDPSTHFAVTTLPPQTVRRRKLTARTCAGTKRWEHKRPLHLHRSRRPRMPSSSRSGHRCSVPTAITATISKPRRAVHRQLSRAPVAS